MFGTLRPTGVDPTVADKLRAMAGLSQQAGNLAFNFGAEKAQKEGKLQGMQSVKRDENGVIAPELKQEGLSIRNKAFNDGAILAHRAQISIDSKERLDALQEEHKLDPDSFKAMANAYKKGTLAGMPEELSVLVASDLDSSISSRKSVLDKDFFHRAEREQKATLADGLESVTDDILNATRKGDLDRVTKLAVESDAMLNQAVESGLVDPVDAQRIREDRAEQITKQNALYEIESVIFNDDLSLDDKIRKGTGLIEAARKADLKDLDPDQKDSVLNIIGAKVADLQRQRAQQQAEMTIEDARRVSNLKIDAKNGLDDATNLMERTEREFVSKKISGNERTSIINDIIGGHGKAVKKLNDYSLVAKKLAGNNPEIVLEQKLIDDYYNEVAMPQLEGLDPTQKIATQAHFVSVLRAVPDRIEKEILNNVLSNDPELIRQSAELIDRIDEIPGLPDLAVTANQRAFVATVNNLAVNMAPEQAIEIANRLTDPTNKARVEAKEAELDEKSSRGYSIRERYPRKVEKEFSNIWGSDYLVAGLNKEQVEKEYADTFEPLFKAGMTAKDAHAKTIDLLKRNWKESQFGFMRNPPEDYYSVQGNTEYIKKQLISELMARTIGLNISDKNVFLFSDDQTAREAASGAPSYRMIVLDNGLQPIILNDEDGRPSNRWMPDKQKEIDRQVKENEKAATAIMKESLNQKEKQRIRLMERRN